MAVPHHARGRAGFGRDLLRGIFWRVMSTFSKRVVLAWGSATLLAASPVGAAPSASPAPAPASPDAGVAASTPPAADSAAPDSAAAAAAAASPIASAGVGSARGTIERGMTELGTLLTRARQSGDMGRTACVQDKHDRAEIVLEVATGELLVLQDSSADGQSRAFAGEKLNEAAERISGLVGQARACQGDQEQKRSDAQNTANQPKTVIPTDPTFEQLRHPALAAAHRPASPRRQPGDLTSPARCGLRSRWPHARRSVSPPGLARRTRHTTLAVRTWRSQFSPLG
ncbi:hypothetical protein [Nannocystis pusilla]|uniref:hypothetical protein n=1 Tax=Nannocystis pusilla TaxID=889268 RepID=UPI003DA5B12D